MPKTSVLLMLFDPKERRFNALKDMELSGVPTKGDKISLNDENGIGQMYLVYDTHYGNIGIDVNIIHLGTVTEYYSAGYPDIPKDDEKKLTWVAF